MIKMRLHISPLKTYQKKMLEVPDKILDCLEL